MTTLAQALETSNRNHINRVRLTGAYAYIDTLEVHVPPCRDRALYSQVQRLGRLEPCRKKQWGHRLIINQPSRAALLKLRQLLTSIPAASCPASMSRSICRALSPASCARS